MDDILSNVITVVKNAGEAVMDLYRGEFRTNIKNDQTLVTDADIQADNIIRSGLSRYGWPVLSEESADNTLRLGAEYVWIVDPLDGTNSFVEGTDEFSVMVGLAQHGKPILAVVYQPPTDKLYFAMRGKGTFLRIGATETRLRASNIASFKDAGLIASRHHFSSDVEAFARALGISKIKRIGSNGIKIGLIAEGVSELFFNSTNKLGEWDTCAPHLILEEAGGSVTGVGGEELIYNKTIPYNSYGILAANGVLHNEALKELKMHTNII